ncbi:hypothetical protein HK405_007649, partial [Cladochytrium tenue]
QPTLLWASPAASPIAHPRSIFGPTGSVTGAASPEAASSVLFHNEATAPPLAFMQPLSHCSFQDTTPFVLTPVADQLLRQTPAEAVPVVPHRAWHLAASSETGTVTAACVAAPRPERYRPDSLLISLPAGQHASSDRAEFALRRGGEGECTSVAVTPMANLSDRDWEATTTPHCASDWVACAASAATARGPGFWNAQAEVEFTPTQSAGMSAPPTTRAIGDKHGLQAAIAASYGATAAPARRSASWPEARSIVVARPAEMASFRSSAILPTATASMTRASGVGKSVSSNSLGGPCTLPAAARRDCVFPVREAEVSMLTGEAATVRRRGGSGAGVPRRVLLFKTELCSSWLETATCEFGAECDFAHSTAELRPVTRHPSWRTKPCNKFWTQGSCPYGNRCAFIHSLEPGHLDATTVTTLTTLATTATSTAVPAPLSKRLPPLPIALRAAVSAAAAAAAEHPTRPRTAPPCCESAQCGGSCGGCVGATPPVPVEAAPPPAASAAAAMFAKRAARARAPADAVNRAALQRHASLDPLRIGTATAAAAAAAAAPAWQSAPASRRGSAWSLASPPSSASPSLSPLSPAPLSSWSSSSSSSSLSPLSRSLTSSTTVTAEELLLIQTRGASPSRSDWGAALVHQRRAFTPTCF